MQPVDDDLERMMRRAAKLGYELRQTATGYLLRRGATSWHSGDLLTLAALLR